MWYGSPQTTCFAQRHYLSEDAMDIDKFIENIAQFFAHNPILTLIIIVAVIVAWRTK